MQDSDMAAPELAEIEVDGLTRESFILRGALAAGAVFGASTVAPFVGEALAHGGGSDIEILNFALTLEYLETEFYDEARSKLSGSLSGLASDFGGQEAQHVQTLQAAIKQLGGKPVGKPKFKFPAIDQKSFLKLAPTLEDTGVSAYNGAGPMLQSKKLLAAAGSIVQIEGRHAAVVRAKAGENPAPDAFDKALTKQQVLAAVKPFVA